MDRRTFIERTTKAAVGATIASGLVYPVEKKKIHIQNKLPQWHGFNLTDFNTPNRLRRYKTTTEEHLKWMADWGFDFVRLPISYPYYLSFDRTKDITVSEVYQIDEEAVGDIEALAYLANKHGLHVSLNLHRAPGYCINAGFHEPYNLWKEEEAQKAFNFHWNFWAKRFKNVSPDWLSFDLLNEPVMREDMNDQLSPSRTIPGELYEKVASGAVTAIRKENKDRIIIADGNNVGNDPTPQLASLKVGQSCRGYYPHPISHFRAPWANKNPEQMQIPVYPGEINGQYFNRESIEKYYQPWVELMQGGVGVHCGECGCWNKTPHDVFLRWFSDVTDVLSENKIGFSLWEFIGDFGILNSGREDVAYEDWHGYKLDKKLLNLIRKYN